MAYVPPVIVLPGVTGTNLRDEYTTPPEVVWSMLRNDYARVALHPDNLRYEAMEPARVQADAVFDIAYKEIIQELRYNLRQKEDKPVPVFPFGYDWRQPLDVIEAQFAEFVNEVIERTKLLRHYADAGYADDPKVNLVGHSMGGLIIAGYLDHQGKSARVAKVATLATPYRGSYEAVIKVATGTANLGTDAPTSREREAARLTPSLYHLLPDIEGGLEIDDPNLPRSLFDARLWQRSVTDSIAEFVRLQAVLKTDRNQQAQTLFNNLLQAAQTYRSRIDNFKLAKAGLRAEDWLCVAGVDSVTRVKLKINKTARGPMFDLGSDFRENLWRKDSENPSKWRLTGDGTVPFESAQPTFLAPENMVCVTPDDFGYWEVQDRVTASVAGFHAIIANMDMLHRMIVRHFTGRPDYGGNTWGRPAPGVSNDKWNPPISMRAK
jgi:pimeloyl-ACP methyl ester carboxylesterase